MDNSRDPDLKRLHAIFSDLSKPKFTRATAYKSYQKIQDQVKDRKLTSMRSRLVQAIRAKDILEVEKIEQLITEYSWRNGWNAAPVN